jgi:hypothetical protein
MGKNLRGNLDLATATAAVRAAAANGLRVGAEHVLEESRRLVPLEEGTLERSAQVTTSDDGMTAAISYGTPYAAYQHERMDLRHPNGRQAKYLETPLNGEREVVGELIARTVRAEAGT